MKTKLLITAMLLFTFATAIIAQDKYEFAIVRSSGPEVLISISGKPMEKIKVDKSEFKDDLFHALLSRISEMSAQGWEVINAESNTAGPGFSWTYYLKRKESKGK